MSNANVRLQLAFTFDLSVPASLAEQHHEDLCKALSELLGPMVFQGMPTVTAKQLGKAGVRVLAHHHHLAARELGAKPVERDALIAAAPHLTDDELLQLERRVRGKTPEAEAELVRFLRRHALAMVNEYRMVACSVDGELTSGQRAQLGARLNLTNGSVLVDDADRQKRLKAGEPLEVRPLATDIVLAASCAGHTLSGPVIEVDVARLATHRDALVQAWQRGESGDARCA